MKNNEVTTYKLTEEEIAEKFKNVKPYAKNQDYLIIHNRNKKRVVKKNDDQ